jgi:hypothetical protein
MNDPNDDGFVGPTRALFTRLTIDYQNDLKPTSWLTLTSGFFYSHVDAGQERPFVSQAFGPQPTFISDETEETAGFLQASITPLPDLNLVAGGRFDHFNQFGDVWTYRFAGSYLIRKTDTTLHASYATGFSPPSSQDKIFGNNFGLEPEKNLGFDVGQGTQDLGFRAETPILFDVRPAVPVKLAIRDHDGKPTVGRFTLYEAGHDYWMYQRFAYRIVMQGYWLEGGSTQFYFQPFYRWVSGVLHLLFGDSSAGEFFWEGACFLVSALLAFFLTKASSGFRCGLIAAVITLAVVAGAAGAGVATTAGGKTSASSSSTAIQIGAPTISLGRP